MLTIRPRKAAWYKAFRGRFRGGWYDFMPGPRFTPMLSTSGMGFGTKCPEAHLFHAKEADHGAKYRLCLQNACKPAKRRP